MLDPRDFLIRKAEREEYAGLADLMARENVRPERHCIHSDLPGGREGLLRDMLGLEARGEMVFVTASSASLPPRGALGCEVDVEVGRGWLRGPFVMTADAAAWEALAAAMLETLLAHLPPEVRCLDSFLNVAHERGNAFYLGHGFRPVRQVHVYVAEKGVTTRGALAGGQPLQPSQRAPAAELHDALFPRTYLTGEMLTRPAEGRAVFVLAEGETVLGYVCATAGTLEDERPEGTVEFLGVRPEARGHGLGERLLLTALGWLFDERGQAAVNLTVGDELTNARALYEKAGFRLRYTGVHTRREWE